MSESSGDWSRHLAALAIADAHDDGAHDLNHLHRVWQTAQTLLGDHAEADALVVMAACYLHDLVNLPKNQPDRSRASTLAAELAVAKLREAGFPVEKLAAVAHAIEAHSFSAGIAPTTIEAKIVQDADRLDALGAVGLARLFYTAGRLGSALAHADDPLGTARALDQQPYALEHMLVTGRPLPATMQTAAGRRLGEERLHWLRQFQGVFVAEWGTGLTV